ncbi:MAG: hypothetical protein M0R06_00380 [Sphaerochaeta sp.]|jgi:hypothetical protein|nr:hypothetical protein [Sphaerochaeta sp.]
MTIEQTETIVAKYLVEACSTDALDDSELATRATTTPYPEMAHDIVQIVACAMAIEELVTLGVNLLKESLPMTQGRSAGNTSVMKERRPL